MPFKKGHKRLGGRQKGSKNDPELQLLDKRLGRWLAQQPEAEFMQFMDSNKAFAYSLTEKRLAKKLHIDLGEETLNSLAAFLSK